MLQCIKVQSVYWVLVSDDRINVAVLDIVDGVVKMLESDAGKLVNVYYEHKGWVTDFVYW